MNALDVQPARLRGLRRGRSGAVRVAALKVRQASASLRRLDDRKLEFAKQFGARIP